MTNAGDVPPIEPLPDVPSSPQDAPPRVDPYAAPPASAAPMPTPAYGQVAPPPAYGQPAYGQPVYGQPAYGQPAYGQPGYSQPGYQYQTAGYAAPAASPSPVRSILSLIFGIVSIVGAGVLFLPFVGAFFGLFFPVAGLVLGILGRKREPRGRGLATAGLILSIVGIVLAVISLIFWIAIFASGGFDNGQFSTDFNDGFQDGLNS